MKMQLVNTQEDYVTHVFQNIYSKAIEVEDKK